LSDSFATQPQSLPVAVVRYQDSLDNCFSLDLRFKHCLEGVQTTRSSRRSSNAFVACAAFDLERVHVRLHLVADITGRFLASMVSVHAFNVGGGGADTAASSTSACIGSGGLYRSSVHLCHC
jgi:hypothetical protein